MVSLVSQASRMGRLATVLGKDVLVLQRFAGREAMSALFDWQVDCLATASEIDFDALIGTHATVTLENHAGARPFDGIVTEARWLGAGENGHRYRLRLQPWLWLASLRRNQRIFHNKTVIQILEELLAAYGDAGKLDVATMQDYPVLEYTVQFRESDMDFACRLMERHGISYHFRHDDGAHAMVLTDLVDAHAPIGTRDFHPDQGHHQADHEHFWAWRPARRITTGAIRLTDYNFKTPNAAMEVDRIGDAAHAQGQIESFDWPGDYLDQGRGRVVAQLRTEAGRGQDRRFEAEGDVLSLSAGARVTLAGDTVPGTGADYLCLVATHSYTSDNYGSGGTQGDDLAYRGHYVLMPDTAPMLPERKTPLADVRGPQTAVVVGEGEIDCDEYGRILVRFHWDLDGAHSMRCRVSQSWAGNGWGGMVIPRIGMEVVVEFLDGDPDQPLVTGCVYNGRKKVPYELPKHKTRSTFKTDTHQGKGFNELRFEDEKGREEIYIHAQKDRNEKTLHNHTERIDNNWVQSVGRNKVIEVDGSHDEVISGQKTLHVGGSRLGVTVSRAMKELTAGISDIAAKLPIPGLRHATGGVFNIIVEKVMNISVFGMSNETVGVSKNILVGRSINMSAGSTITIDASQILALSGNADASISSTGTIALTCGDAAITLGANGDIYIQGRNLFVDVSNIAEVNTGNRFDIDGANEVSVKAKRINLN
jgi:type VI secretion system secreted protein VgrG